ncbi:uncharacterized protein PFL1_06896 [Pseudozyma flocculosa PF-1]|nr:uncharacterized protein PFL1_06896 [Pseudozyma flocculosa PF-1]EPQ27103.1 hypothetical protein PFL1_06896 [Pseudozyma flocculosa PF-1]
MTVFDTRPPRKAILLALSLLTLVTLLSSATSPVAWAASSPRTGPTTADVLSSRSASGEALDASSYIKRHPTLPVLGYVTPWNAAGKALVEEFRNKFDLVAPVWYTVHADEKRTRRQGRYEVRGGPASKADKRWVERLQRPPDAYHSPLKVVPRFLLEGWQQRDYVELLSNRTLWSSLASSLVDEVQSRGYDGLVFESSATYLLQEPLSLLATSLHDAGKLLVLVLPPIRTRTSLGVRPSSTFESQNTMILQSLPALSKVADYFSIMTYDMTGAGGREAKVAASDLPADSPLRQVKRGTLRQPGPNTHPEWIRENLVAAIESSGSAGGDNDQGAQAPFGIDEAAMDPTNPFPSAIVSETTLSSVLGPKWLMGLPMYGYTYPLFFLDLETGRGIPLDPSSASALHSPTTLPILRGPGRPLTSADIVRLLKTHRPSSLELDDESGESFFDYLEPSSAAGSGSDGGGGGGGGGGGEDKVFWRAYIPTGLSMDTRIEAVLDVQAGFDVEAQTAGRDTHGGRAGGQGLALWEVGQADRDLLASL